MKAEDFHFVTKGTTKTWAKQRKAEERSSRARSNRVYMYSDRVNQTDIADAAIPKAYLWASNDGINPAHARQIYYAARPEIQEKTGRQLKDKYFTQVLLPKYISEHPEETAGWWVVYDARGHLYEPHTKERVDIGTLDVDRYLSRIEKHAIGGFELGEVSTRFPTIGPKHRYSAIMFVEKEGFNPLFRHVKLAERYDLAIMSTKGQSNVSARRLVDELCGGDVPLLILHDFDKQGFEISQTLTSVSEAAWESGRVRYEFNNDVNVIDLGLRLTDITKWKLQSEKVRFNGTFDGDSIATKEEQDFLRSGRRVELNAFSSGDFIAWIESKLAEHKIKKVVPDEDTLERAYRRAIEAEIINRRSVEIREAAGEEAEQAKVPKKSLAKMIRAKLKDSPELPWDVVLAKIAAERVDD